MGSSSVRNSSYFLVEKMSYDFSQRGKEPPGGPRPRIKKILSQTLRGFSMIQSILCPTDLTADSKEGISYAFTLAERNSAQLILLHVTSFPLLWQYPCELDARDRWQQLVFQFNMDRVLAEGQRKVRKFVRERFKAESNSVGWTPRIAVGSVAEEIVTAALQEEADLIIMDRRQRPWLARLLTTGVLERVSRNAPCPVLLIDGADSIHRSGEWRMPLLEEVPQTF